MGSAETNFYNDAYARQGYAEVAAESQTLWVDGRRDEAAAVIPDEMVLATSLIGTEEMVGARLWDWQAVGIDQVRLYPAGSTLEERLSTLGRALDLVADLESRP
jgi:alkanesulfonate monooxygenase SsuD/methylene tetrahydromethanopterin reductase-like flavin-dependent oxidoreductase (luciferase family)